MSSSATQSLREQIVSVPKCMKSSLWEKKYTYSVSPEQTEIGLYSGNPKKINLGSK